MKQALQKFKYISNSGKAIRFDTMTVQGEEVILFDKNKRVIFKERARGIPHIRGNARKPFIDRIKKMLGNIF